MYEWLTLVSFICFVIGGYLIAPALALIVAGLGIGALAYALSKEKPAEPYTEPEGLDSLRTASPEAE